MISRQMRHDLFDHSQHHVLRLADRKTADRVAVKSDIDERARARDPQVRDVAALHNSEQCASVPVIECALAALGPAQRELHRALDVGSRRRQADAFVKLHRNVGAEQTLDLDRTFGREHDRRAVDMGAEGHGLFRRPCAGLRAT